MNSRFLQSLALILLTLSVSVFASLARTPIEHPFPMSPGTFWVYRGTIRWTHDINHVSETKITWRTTIRRTMQHGEFSAAVISGFPSDLNWSDGHPPVTESLLIEAHGRFYLISGEQFQDAVKQFEQPSDGVGGLLDENDLFLQWPLKPKMKFCDQEGMTRPDNRYCWFVASSRIASLNGISGVGSGNHREFVIQYRTNPDDNQFSFAPGVGITQYSYHHHGTVADTELQLVEFHPAVESN